MTLYKKEVQQLIYKIFVNAIYTSKNIAIFLYDGLKNQNLLDDFIKVDPNEVFLNVDLLLIKIGFSSAIYEYKSKEWIGILNDYFRKGEVQLFIKHIICLQSNISSTKVYVKFLAIYRNLKRSQSMIINVTI